MPDTMPLSILKCHFVHFMFKPMRVCQVLNGRGTSNEYPHGLHHVLVEKEEK